MEALTTAAADVLWMGHAPGVLIVTNLLPNELQVCEVEFVPMHLEAAALSPPSHLISKGTTKQVGVAGYHKHPLPREGLSPRHRSQAVMDAHGSDLQSINAEFASYQNFHTSA
jgi:hypothetical protein